MSHIARSPRITRRTAGEINLLSEINQLVKGSQPRPTQSLAYIYRSMQRGDSVFLPGYTANSRDRKLIKTSPAAYTRDKNWVWTVRSTVERGIKGLRVYRAA
jgi:hypothetical protein